ncbi:MAG: amidohydrolase [Firmicutes bacterium]|nr:amidohydrolase [Bacillota bacterium]
MLFKNAMILDENLNPVENCYVSVKDGAISYVGKERPEGVFGYERDCRGKLLMSGFYNAHAHSPMSLMRGYGENMMLQDWLFTRIFPFEDKLDGNAVYWGTMLAMAESVKYGIVSTSDMYYFCEDMARAVADSGAKANISRSVANPTGDKPENLPSIRETQDFYKNFHNYSDNRIKVDISLHAEYTSDFNTAKALAEIAADIKDTVMHVHVSETESEHRECIDKYGMTPAAYLESAGLFDVPAIAAHCVWSTDEDMEIFKRKGVTIATNTVSNMKLASGIFNASKAVEKGVKLALGTDSVASNNNLNFFEEMKLLAIGSKIAKGSAVALAPGEIIYAATAGGAEAQGRKDCGKIKEGNRADLILIDINTANMHPVHNIINNLVYSCSESNLEMTMADGKILWDKGEYTTIDIEKTIFEAEKATKGILERL